MKKLSTAYELAKELVEAYPDKPAKQLARTLIENNKPVYNDIEHARTAVRYFLGSQGDKHRTRIPKEKRRDPELSEMFRNNPFGLPKECNDNWRPMPFPVKQGKGLCLFDAHIPYHDNQAISIGVNWAIQHGYTDFLFLGGDILDCYMLSKFQKDPRKRSFKGELDDVKQFLVAMRKIFRRLIFKKGNHENRIIAYFQTKALELFDLQEFIWDKYLPIDELGVIMVPADTPLTVGRLNIIHGHELTGSHSPVNAARGAYLKAVDCIMLGHYHRTSMHAETSFTRRLDTAWSVGCVCNLNPEYMRINKWNHGFAGLEVDGKNFEIENKRIIKGRVV